MRNHAVKQDQPLEIKSAEFENQEEKLKSSQMMDQHAKGKN